MGATGSKSATLRELKDESNAIRIMSDELFKYMYSTWKPRDVWDIAQNPSKYVIAISDLITTQFHVIGYRTRAGRMGEIYFKKFEDLEPPLGSNSNISSAEKANRNAGL